jgi:hypothetical protein
MILTSDHFASHYLIIAWRCIQESGLLLLREVDFLHVEVPENDAVRQAVAVKLVVSPSWLQPAAWS